MIPQLEFVNKNSTLFISIDDGNLWIQGPIIYLVSTVNLFSIYPASVYFSSRSIVWIRGQNFYSFHNISCKVGTAGHLVKPILIRDDYIMCLLPSLIDLSLIYSLSIPYVEIPVTVVNNIGYYRSPPLYFRYIFNCIKGTYLRNAVCQDCPPGAMCPVDGMTSFFLCPPGTFQPSAKSVDCILCPAGTICHSHGMAVPSLCPPGFACNVESSAVPSEVCPAGSFCTLGVVNSTVELVNATLFQHWLNLHPDAIYRQSGIGAYINYKNANVFVDLFSGSTPIECSFSTFCDYGSVTNLTSFRHNSNHFSKYCLSGSYCGRGSLRPEGNNPLPAGFFVAP